MILPTQEHIKEINEHFKVLISRALVVQVPCLKKHKEYATIHIRHKYSEVMSHSTFLVCMIPLKIKVIRLEIKKYTFLILPATALLKGGGGGGSALIFVRTQF